eukprot:scaffold41701_cov31-Tisochrysis_lutea.AAC.4
MRGVVEVGRRVAEAEALRVHLAQAKPVRELDSNGLAVVDEVSHCVVEPGGEGARRCVLRDGAPADDVKPRHLLDQLVPERGSVAPVEEYTLEARGRLARQLANK